MAKPSSVDWTPIRAEYITTKCTQDYLAHKYGVSRTQVSRVATREKWKEQREKYLARCLRKSTEKAANKEAARLAKLAKATTKAIDVAMGALEDDKQFNRYIVTEGQGPGVTEVKEREFAKVDTKALRDLTAVIKDLSALMREFYNLPTAAEAEARRIAADRLELDKRKLEAAESTEPATVRVIIDDSVEEYGK